MKKRILLGAGALALAAVPATIGLWGNASFAESVPVRVPASGQVATGTPVPTAVVSASPSPSASLADDRGGEVARDQRIEPGDDRDIQGATPTAPAPGDDGGGVVARDQRTEPGDDRRSDDSGRDRGEDDVDTSGHGDDDARHGGHGGDD
jgi:hypothetical protein